ncbi:hypothetical protein [Verminephrobacter aporrectodeae]|uniref:hypothetical protein n=1 Tax=Verminephrobacter aporrectodeae TaxID=1110389 RepID=UPI002238334A|nr:hypothetical protein [Verminephrobacter aporrectodeae]
MNTEQIKNEVMEYVDFHYQSFWYATDDKTIARHINEELWDGKDLQPGEKVSDQEIRDVISSLLSEKKIQIFDWDDEYKGCIINAEVKMADYAKSHGMVIR